MDEYVVVGYDLITGNVDIVMWTGEAASEEEAIRNARAIPENAEIEINDVINLSEEVEW